MKIHRIIENTISGNFHSGTSLPALNNEAISPKETPRYFIAQGWRMNSARKVIRRNQIFDSIVDYIEMTYGTHRRAYAA